MCQGFGLIVTRDAAYFVEPGFDGNVSHSEILRRLGWQDCSELIMRSFVRVEYPDWTEASFRFDEDSTLPGWADNDDIKQRCHTILSKCDAAWAEYEKVRDAAWAEYEKVRDAALAEYEKVRAPAWAEYEKVSDAAWADLIAKFALVPGYVGEM